MIIPTQVNNRIKDRCFILNLTAIEACVKLSLAAIVLEVKSWRIRGRGFNDADLDPEVECHTNVMQLLMLMRVEQ